jgi:hypothetical protein
MYNNMMIKIKLNLKKPSRTTLKVDEPGFKYRPAGSQAVCFGLLMALGLLSTSLDKLSIRIILQLSLSKFEPISSQPSRK